jgi:hypothetical protein
MEVDKEKVLKFLEKTNFRRKIKEFAMIKFARR